MKAVSDLLSEKPEVEMDHLDVLPGPPYFEEDLGKELKHYDQKIFPSSIETQEVGIDFNANKFNIPTLSMCHRS